MFTKKDVNEVRFVIYSSKYQNENKILHISTIPRFQSELLYHNIAKGKIRLLVSGKVDWKQILKFKEYQITGWTKTQTYAGVKKPFQRYRKILISDECNENESKDEDGERNSEIDTS